MTKLRVTISENLAKTFLFWFSDAIESGANLDDLTDDYAAFSESVRKAVRRDRRDSILGKARKSFGRG